MIDGSVHKELMTALEWYVDVGVTDILMDETIDRTVMPELQPVAPLPEYIPTQNSPKGMQSAPAFLGKSDARIEAVRIAKEATTLDELRNAIAEFDGVAIKKTATNMVFSDGNPKADIMLIGEAPATDEDREGKSFAGANGQLLDKMLKCIELYRTEEDPKKSIYLSNILNWRPPGNRSPSPAEIEVSLPFIERHIQLAKPKILILCGGVAAKALLGRSESISRLRKTWHEYTPQTIEIRDGACVTPALAMYTPSSLISAPAQKKSAWEDLLVLHEKRSS